MIKKCLTVVAAVLLLGACDSTEPRVPTAVEVDQQTVSIESSDTLTIEAVIVDQSGRPYLQMPTGFQITWSSSNASIVSVSNGRIRGERPGEAIITARAGDLEPAEIHVTVAVRTVTSEISFQFSGHRNGTFAVDTTFRLDAIDWDGNWGFTWHDTEFDDQDVLGQRLRSDGKVDFLWFWSDQAVTGTGAREAYGGVFLFGYDVELDTVEGFYEGSGTVNFTSVTPRQLGGTFSLGMGEVDEDGEFTGAVLDITSGTFSVPLVTIAEIDGDIAGDGTAGRVEVPERLRQLRAARR